ncbi:FecR family protein [Pedobacter caeni]|uniref:FecR family protein n=1 Tax=Pedobacter caeni TaxID=288992 RepID=A0A1M4TWX7_9SPHI|nr:FecR domain-containing protein [Pedobacter caeni]SHE48985.1 FecR family protein [Pedobacter caeni]
MSRNSNMETEQINSLLAKHFAKETNTEEELILLDWIKSNPEEYLSLKILWADSHVSGHQQLFSSDQAWRKVSRQINFEAQPDVSEGQSYVSLVKSKKTSYWLAAASIVLIISAALFFYTTSAVTITTQLAEIKNITLSDGSTVTLNENSTLSYPRYFLSKRNIELDGEAFFEVKHDVKKPFVVHTKQFLVNVLGTSFLVNSSEKNRFVNVKSGKVAVKDKISNTQLVLLAGQGARLQSGTLQMERLNNENYLAWKTKELNFTDSPLKEVFSTLENYYHVRITPDNTGSLNCKVTSKFKNETLADVLKELQLLFGFNYKITDNQVSISAITCR